MTPENSPSQCSGILDRLDQAFYEYNMTKIENSKRRRSSGASIMSFFTLGDGRNSEAVMHRDANFSNELL